jgi:16S rRNA (guanine527-N7)-methyltransferase
VEQAAWRSRLRTEASALGIQLDERTLDQFSLYLDELRRWNEKVNLSSLKLPEEIAIKHFLDSLVGLKALIRRGTAILDIGAGAGFPGLPLKIYDPSFELTLLEPSSKKTAFLRHIIGRLGLRAATVVTQRIEQLVRDEVHRARYAYVITRAVNVAAFLPALPALMQETGQVVLWRTMRLESDVQLGGLRVAKEIPYALPENYGMKQLIVMERTGLV